MTYQEVISNKDIIKIISSLVKQYRKIMPREDIEFAITTGILEALRDYNGRTKLISYIGNRIRWNCGTFVSKYKQNISRDTKINHISRIKYQHRTETKLPYLNIDLEQLDSSEQEFIYEYYYCGYTLREIAAQRGYSRETARRHKDKILEKLRTMFV